MYILSLLYGLSIHNSFSFCPNVFTFSIIVVDKGTSGCRSITSSIYLNWNISVIYYRIKIKLVFKKAEWRCFLIRKNYFFKSLPGLADMTSSSIQLRISLLSYVGLSLNSVRVVPWCHLKYHVILKVTLTFGVNFKVNAYYFFLVWCVRS